MKIENTLSDSIILQEIGTRIARYRLNKNMTQAMLAKESGISLPTLQRIELGTSINMVNLIRILRALNLLDNMELIIPEITVSPIQQIKMHGKIRRRASSVSQKTVSPDPLNIPWLKALQEFQFKDKK